MYAYIAAGRLVCTEIKVVDNNHCLMCLPNYHEVNSLAVFLTGAIAHQEGVATAIYISFPTQSIDDQNFIYIGFISNQKPSAFFRLNQLKNLEPYQGGLQVAVSNAYSNSNLQPQSTAFLYFSHEPISEIESKVSVNESEKRSSTTNLLHRKQFQIQNLIENFYNYATSFVTSTSNLKASFSNPIDDQKLWIPVDCLNKWYEIIMNKLSLNPSYLKPN